MKHAKQIALLTVALLIIVAQLIIPASAANTVLANLLPSKDTAKGKLTLTGCTLAENSDGSVTFTLTATSATFKMEFAQNVYQEESGGTIISGDAIDVTKGAYVVYDYASADGVALNAIAHYTRKDKAAGNTLADLYLSSMEGNDYKQYQKSAGTGYGVWDIGAYITGKSGALFDNHLHRFCNLEGTLTGKVGAKLTLYKFYISSASQVEGLGKVRPEPTKFESSSSAASAATSSAASSAASSVAGSESKAVSSEQSGSVSSASSAAKSSATSSVKSASSAAGESDSSEDSNTLLYVLIAVGAVIVIGAIVFFAVKKKK